jgi:hypothetical protein
MKTDTNTTNTDTLLHSLIATLRKSGTRCGTGAEIKNIWAQR